MDTERAFFRLIAESPTATLPRLVYADWLDDQNRGRAAKLVRLQARDCELREAPDADDDNLRDVKEAFEDFFPECRTHEERPIKLRDPFQLSVDWPGRRWVKRVGYRESHVNWNAERQPGRAGVRRMVRSLEALRLRFPLHTLNVLRPTVEQLDELLRHRVVESLFGLGISGVASPPATGDEWVRLVAAARLPRLATLSLTFQFSVSGFESLAAADFPSVTELCLHAHHLSPVGVRHLAGADWFRGLRWLDIDYAAEGSPPFDGLSEFPTMPRLDQLSIKRTALVVADLRAGLTAARFPRLRELNLFQTSLTADHARAIAGFPGPRLRCLELSRNAIGGDGLAAIAGAAFLPELRELYFGINGVTPDGLEKLAAAPCPRLERLLASHNPIGPSGLLELARGPAFGNLRWLDVSQKDTPARNRLGVTAADVVAFLRAGRWPRLRHLDLEALPVGVRGASVLASDPKFAGLRRLQLWGCRIGDAGATAILRSPHLQQIVKLGLEKNGLTTAPGLLAEPGVMPALGEVSVADNPLDPRVGRRIRRRPGVEV